LQLSNDNGKAPPQTEPASHPRKGRKDKEMAKPNTPQNDELNAELALQTLETELLLRLVGNPAEAITALSKCLASRGLDLSGNWVGHQQAGQLHERRMANTQMPRQMRQVPSTIMALAQDEFKGYDPCHLYGEMLGNYPERLLMQMSSLRDKADLRKVMAEAAETIEQLGVEFGESRAQAFSLIR